MAFLTSLILQADLDVLKSALVAIGETESRHNTWSLINIWKTDPFAGPSDTIFPYANEILDATDRFIISSSCPKDNPPYPYPSQHLPTLDYHANSTTAQPGSRITFSYPNPANQPNFDPRKWHYSITFMVKKNFSMPYDVATNTLTIPSTVELHKGLIIIVIADEEVAPTLESVVAGPLFLMSQPDIPGLG